MTIEIKIQFTDVAQAVAFLAAGEKAVSRAELKQDLTELQRAALDVVAAYSGQMSIAGEANSAGTTVVSNPSPEAISQEVPKAEGKRGPGRPRRAAETEASNSAAPAAAASPASPSASAPEPTPAVEPPPPAPAKPKTYEESDFPARIMKLVADQKETGNGARVDALKAHLASLGIRSARELKPEQLGAFGEKLAEIEGLGAAAEEALG